MNEADLHETLRQGVWEIFQVAMSWEPQPGARRLSLGGALPAAYVQTDQLSQLVQIRRYLLREAELRASLRQTTEQLDRLRMKTTTLIPETPDGFGLRDWSAENMDLGLLSHLDGCALAVDGEVLRSEGIDMDDVLTTLRVLQRHPQRSLPVRRGELFGIRDDRVAIVLFSEEPLEKIDRDLARLLATWTGRLLTEQEHLRRLDRLRISAEQTADDKAAFLAHMSHELRTPLNGILGIAQVLEDTPLQASQRRLLEQLLESGSWLHQLINEVLDLSKLEAGHCTPEQLDFSLTELLTTCCESLKPLAQLRQITLTCTISPDLPRAVRGDPTGIRKALLNLLSNALKFTRSRVLLRASLQEDGRVRVEVEDDGIGIPADRIEAIFEPFTQATADTTRNYGGTGLGLPLVRRLARLHGGDAGAVSAPGEGSTFWLTAELPPAERAEAVPQHSTEGCSPLRVLVVEDHPINQLVARQLLEAMGHTVEVAVNGREGLQRLGKGQDFDIVLMDHMMPEMDGVEATRRIRAMGGGLSRLPIVALTAAVTSEDLSLYQDAGFDDVLSKPIQKSRIAQCFGSLFAAP